MSVLRLFEVLSETSEFCEAQKANLKNYYVDLWYYYLYAIVLHLTDGLYSICQLQTIVPALREKHPGKELFLVRIFLYSVRIQENTDHK